MTPFPVLIWACGQPDEAFRAQKPRKSRMVLFVLEDNLHKMISNAAFTDSLGGRV